MKAIILNSGMGTRLEDLTKSNPKSLIEIKDNQTIFSNAINILSKFDIDEYIITTGYLSDVLESYALENFPNINFRFVNNPIYDKTNYIKSLDLIEDFDDDLILLHGDLVFTYQTAEKVINSDFPSVVVDSTVPLPKDDFKAKVANGLVKYIGVDYFEDDALECQAFYKLSNDFWKIWKERIREFCKNDKDNVYAENALNELLKENILKLKGLDLKGSLCMEVDTKEDLQKAKKLMDE